MTINAFGNFSVSKEDMNFIMNMVMAQTRELAEMVKSGKLSNEMSLEALAFANKGMKLIGEYSVLNH